MREGYTMRTATVEDLSLVLHHRRRMFEDMGYRDRQALDHMSATSAVLLRTGLVDGNYRGWLVEASGRVVAGGGVISLEFQPHPRVPTSRRSWIVNVYTEPEHRRKGLARWITETIVESCRIKADVVSKDERESGLRRILNFGHTVGHALESETNYERFLHGEAVAFGMKAAAHLAAETGILGSGCRDAIVRTIDLYGQIPSFGGITAESLVRRLASDKKTIQGKVHFVLPDRIGHVVVRSGIGEDQVLAAIRSTLS